MFSIQIILYTICTSTSTSTSTSNDTSPKHSLHLDKYKTDKWLKKLNYLNNKLLASLYTNVVM